jgi:chaperonin cofactor prefoldin
MTLALNKRFDDNAFYAWGKHLAPILVISAAVGVLIYKVNANDTELYRNREWRVEVEHKMAVLEDSTSNTNQQLAEIRSDIKSLLRRSGNEHDYHR